MPADRACMAQFIADSAMFVAVVAGGPSVPLPSMNIAGPIS